MAKLPRGISAINVNLGKEMITDANDTGIKVVAFINATGGHFSVCGR
jgi:hypothetical protein